MRVSSVISRVLLAAALTGCSTETPSPPASTPAYSELPPRKTTVSGIIFDPEAFYFSLKTFPSFPDSPPPPGMLIIGIPHLTRSVPVGARVSVVDGDTVADSSEVVTPAVAWQVPGVPTDDTIEYALRAEPHPEAGGISIGAPEDFPAPFFEPVPPSTYHPTTSLSPLRTLGPSCVSQVAMMVGEAGALSAVASYRTSHGTPTTVADLLNPAKVAGVALVWVISPSPFMDFFHEPLGDVEMVKESGQGTVYALDWQLPGSVAGQSPMGYYVSSASISPIGYYAIVFPPGATEPVSLGFTDTVTELPPPPDVPPSENGLRPYPLAPAFVPVRPGVSILRTFAFPSLSYPPPSEDEEYVPPTDMSWLCR
ncbi:hypothetical protein JQX13_00195 [Archangium violaceum]|uniref:hypothetical protein n=1 Tax=Archangium violaceum TaxID=83451 RepID=UPI00193BAB00|nr:hypothetical protein [Archangium violaceum]QRK08651.1 hypothetical protein JQX13_00195 [Archangium violaceum]